MHVLDYVMDFYTAITSVANTINKLNIMYNLHYSQIHNFYNDKQESIDDMFCQYKHLLKYIDHPALIQ